MRKIFISYFIVFSFFQTTKSQTQLNSSLPFLGNVTDFQISPDGNTVVYLSDQITNDIFELFSVSVTGGTPVKLNGDLPNGGDVLSNFKITPDGNNVVYIADQVLNGKDELFIVSIDGSNNRKLNDVISNSRDVNGFVVSSNNDDIVYWVSDDVFSVSLSSGNSVILGNDVVDFTVSNDGNTVVYRNDQNTNSVLELFAIPIDGGVSIQLNGTLPSGGDVQSGFKISQDNTTVVYRADQNADNFLELFSVPITGGTTTRLNTNLPIPNGGGDVDSFAISDDSQTVVYLADQITTDLIELFSVPISGGTPIRLNPDLASIFTSDVFDFKISPDNTNVVYRAEQNSGGAQELFSVPIAGGTANQLNIPIAGIQDVKDDYQISADGLYVIHTADADSYNKDEVFSTPITGGSPLQINKNLVSGGDIFDFKVSENGKYIIYRADQDNNDVSELYISSISESSPVKISGDLTSGGDVKDDYKVSEDGKYVIYRADQDVDEEVKVYSVSLSSVLSLNQNNISKNYLTVYPNPAKNWFKIQNSHAVQLEKVIVYDVTGKKVLSHSGDGSIYTESLKSGFYLVHIVSEANITIQKLMIK